MKNLKQLRRCLLTGFFGLSLALAGCSGDDGAAGVKGADGADAPVVHTVETCGVCHGENRLANTAEVHRYTSFHGADWQLTTGDFVSRANEQVKKQQSLADVEGRCPLSGWVFSDPRGREQ